MSDLTAENKKQLQTAAYCIEAMLSGETLTYEKHSVDDLGSRDRTTTITNIEKLADAISGGNEITFEGGTPMKHLDFAKLSDKAKGALAMLWTAPVSPSLRECVVIDQYGQETFDELDKLLFVKPGDNIS